MGGEVTPRPFPSGHLPLETVLFLPGHPGPLVKIPPIQVSFSFPLSASLCEHPPVVGVWFYLPSHAQSRKVGLGPSSPASSKPGLIPTA